MVFSSYIFLFYFLPLVLAAYYASPARARSLVLVVASYVFYGWWRPDFCLLMLISTSIDFACGRALSRIEDPGRRKIPVVVSAVANLGFLAYFKYANFVAENMNAALGWAGREPMAWESIALPIGISFYTFQTMSYTIDLYRRKAPPAKSFIDFACYVSLFPQLIAGPIVRYATLAEQLVERDHTLEKFSRGVFLFMVGFAKKVLLANNVSEMADLAFDGGPAGFFDAWIGLFAYTFQIYFDFSGYSDMAIGLGLMFGFTIPKNFDLPYRSRSITEFWRRWHISLSSWLRDYLYIPLGGNRRGKTKTYLFLMITMLLGGLWHGSHWTFILWGGYHGCLLAWERSRGKSPLYHKLPGPLPAWCTMLLVMIGWVVFRAESVGAAGAYMGALVGLEGGGLHPAAIVGNGLTAATLAACFVVVSLPRHSVDFSMKLTTARRAMASAIFMVAVLQMFFQRFNPFLYFQF